MGIIPCRRVGCMLNVQTMAIGSRSSIIIIQAYLSGIPLQMYELSHIRTVVRECFKGDEASQWKRPKFDPSPHQNPLTDLHKNWQA